MSIPFYLKNYGIIIVRQILSFLIPVKTGKVLFQSSPDYSDNSRAFSDYLLNKTNLHIFWSVSNCKHYQSTDRITFVEKEGGRSLISRLRFVYHTVSSQYLFSTHGAFLFANKKKQKYVCLWHGMPLKKIAQLLSKDNVFYLNNASYILCTSAFYAPIICQCFGKKKDEVLITGIPRNDWLFRASDVIERIGIEKKKGEKLIVYLPTFRKTSLSEKGETKQNVLNVGGLDFSSEKSLNNFNEFLRQIHTKLLVKPHPADPYQIEMTGYSNIYVLPHSKFLELDIQLNHVLYYADALITDFSGVFIDYLNLDRPIGFILSDLEEYTKNRGFLFKSPLNYMPGVKIYTDSDLEKFCKDVADGIDVSKSERERLRQVYNDYSDGSNCKRLADYLGIKTNN